MKVVASVAFTISFSVAARVERDTSGVLGERETRVLFHLRALLRNERIQVDGAAADAHNVHGTMMTKATMQTGRGIHRTRASQQQQV